MRSMRSAFIGVGVFSFFINLLMLTGPIYMLQVYDRVLSSQSVSTLLSLTMLMGILYVFVWLLERVRSKVLTRIGNSLESELSAGAFEGWMRLGLGNHDKGSGSPIKDLSSVRKFFSSNAMATIFDLPWVPIYLGVIFLLHWTMGVFAVIGAGVIICCAMYVEFVAKAPQEEERQYKLKAQSIEQQMHRSADMVQAMGMEKNLYSHWHKLNTMAQLTSTYGTDRINGVRAFSKAFRLFLQSGMLGIGAALAINQVVSPGTMIAGSIILGRALAPAQSLISQWALIVTAKAAYKRLDSIQTSLDSREEHIQLPMPQGVVEVRNLVAGPPNSEKPVLIGLNFTVRPGDALGVVGPSGCGKSTLARLLVGNWLPQKGDVRMDGASFAQWHASQIGKDFGQHIGYLPQKVEMFDGTVRDNIARFDPNATEGGILDAAQRAGVHELILNLPQSYNTVLGRNGLSLSGGQMQRIALARALYNDPCFVVLDEPNSNLDEDGERALHNVIVQLRSRGKSVVIITHRPNAIQGVTKILVLRQGRQLVFGYAEDVLKKLKRGQLPTNGRSSSSNPSGYDVSIPEIKRKSTSTRQTPLPATVSAPSNHDQARSNVNKLEPVQFIPQVSQNPDFGTNPYQNKIQKLP